MSEVLVIAETTAAGVRKPTLELLTAARALGEPAAVVFGKASDAVVAQLGEYGATKVYAVGAPEVSDYLSLPKAEAVVQIAGAVNPVAILVTSGGQACADVGGASILPNDGFAWRAQGLAVPQHDRLALVGDADRGQLSAVHLGKDFTSGF